MQSISLNGDLPAPQHISISGIYFSCMNWAKYREYSGRRRVRANTFPPPLPMALQINQNSAEDAQVGQRDKEIVIVTIYRRHQLYHVSINGVIIITIITVVIVNITVVVSSTNSFPQFILFLPLLFNLLFLLLLLLLFLLLLPSCR